MRPILLILIFSIIIALSSSKILVDKATRFLKDEYGRTRFYHGVNAVYKVFPFIPISTHFDKDNSLSDEDFANLKKWGLTFIRLHTPWEGIEPIRGQYNMTLVKELKALVQKAQKYNITILLDAHQDLLSRKYCGEGMPDWAVLNNDSFPSPVRSSITRDEGGYPVISDCLKSEFAKYYFSYDVGKTFEDLFTNVQGLSDSYGAFWRLVASEFKNEANVIGYEIINEPFFANLYSNWREIVDFGYGDLHFLQPFYRKIHEYIREVDDQSLIFFENIVVAMTVGFTEGPGGAEYNDRQVFSYHVYCGFTPTNVFIKYGCKAIDWIQYSGKLKKAESLGFSTFLTEFGALYNSADEVQEIGSVARTAENRFQSWAYWQFKNFHDITTSSLGSQEGFYLENGQLQENKIAALAVTYVYALCGQPISNDFDRGTGMYILEFNPGKCSKNSEIYISEDYYYKERGFKFSFQGCQSGKCDLKKLEDRYYYEMIVPNDVQGKITLKIESN